MRRRVMEREVPYVLPADQAAGAPVWILASPTNRELGALLALEGPEQNFESVVRHLVRVEQHPDGERIGAPRSAERKEYVDQVLPYDVLCELAAEIARLGVLTEDEQGN